ncbi:MAG: DNA replication/repair protein RecF [Anaerolineae bacterium]|nr:MAG: DNA replication/repair protein RecF [Anaerolineae bacterium]
MLIQHLSLTNIRNYSRLELDLSPGSTLLHGDNAQGKTNLLEAIYYLATTRSPQAERDRQLINWDADDPGEPIVVGRLVTHLSTLQGDIELEMRLIRELNRGNPSFRREALVNRRKVRLMDLIGNLRVVLFLPEDVQIITGSPSQRRRYIDITLCQTDRDYCRALSDYNKTLEQRNALLRRIAETGSGMDLLPVYDENLAKLGSVIFLKRGYFISKLAVEAQRVHFEELTDGKETLALGYLPRLSLPRPRLPQPDERSKSQANQGPNKQAIEDYKWLQDQSNWDHLFERFLEELTKIRDGEIASGMTRIGPHRDDWRLWVNGREMSAFGSRGQQRSGILAIKLAEILWMESQTGDKPVLLLDEVVAELDETRRALILAAVTNASQSILTATDPGMFTNSFLEQAALMRVDAGRISQDQR